MFFLLLVLSIFSSAALAEVETAAISVDRCARIFESLSQPAIHGLLKRPFTTEELGDLADGLSATQLIGEIKVDAGDSNAVRLSTISHFKLKDILAAPGHRVLKFPELVEGMQSHINRTKGGEFAHEPVLINLRWVCEMD